MTLHMIAAILLAAFIASIAWVWRDAERRGQPGFIVAVLVTFLFWPFSLIVWLLARPKIPGSKEPERRNWSLFERRSMKSILSIALVVLVLGVAAWAVADYFKKPIVRAVVNTSDTYGFLTIESSPPGATVYVKVKEMDKSLRFADGQFNVEGTYEGTDWMKIGTTPLKKYKLADHNTVNIQYVYGFIRGKKLKTTKVDCVYDVKVEKEGFCRKIVKSVVLTPENEASFSVGLTTDSHDQVPATR